MLCEQLLTTTTTSGPRGVPLRGAPDSTRNLLISGYRHPRQINDLEENSPVAGFLGCRGMAPAHDLCRLLEAGDIESNPGPIQCHHCSVTLRSGLPHFSCATTTCTARCHKKIECSGVSRYSTTQEWKCTKHGGRTTTPVVSTVPSTLPTNCAVCKRAFRARRRSLSCEDDSCSAQCHLKKSCSNLSRNSPEIWLCSSHSYRTCPLGSFVPCHV